MNTRMIYGYGKLPSPEKIMNAQTKPADVSAVRWRMELRRRAMPERYAFAAEPQQAEWRWRR